MWGSGQSWEEYCAEEQEWEEHCPICDKCGEPITDETYYDIDGRIMHKECMEEEYEKWTDKYVERERERRYEQARER